MNSDTLKQYLSSKYQGWNSFRDTIIIPIFGEEEYFDEFDTELLDVQPERRALADSTGIRSVLLCGKVYVSGEPLQFFEVTVSDRVMMDRNRVNIKRLIHSVMDYFSSAFILFHYDDETRWDWRFSFCYKHVSEEESTDRKRYTFLLGPGQSCRTAAENFICLYNKHLNNERIEIQDIVDAFNVEALSKEFFEGYKKRYEDIIFFVTGKRMVKVGNKWEERLEGEPNQLIMNEFASFKDPEKAVRDYVKKLMGRLVFLQFLQKKGWLGVPVDKEWGSGDGEFVQKLFAQTEDKQHFIDNVLEPLFDDLNTERANDLASPAVGSNIRVPYLNGGLFERDEADETSFPLPGEYIHSILEFFSWYNFTIDENDPNDAEVGVDPEMLGRIFENLLEDNKDKGAFYTPKEIVTYMCRESLIAYLQTDVYDEQQKEAIREFVISHELQENLPENIDQRLKDVKICDPAIGSGAFPMGLLKELFLCRTAIEGFEQSKASEIKKHIIQNNIYGVDIERGAVDIARLRFWLSLIVDENTPHALPNLDYKIVEGNSLITTFDGQYIDLEKGKGEARHRPSLICINREMKLLQQEQKRFFALSGDEKYRSEISIKNHILNIIWYQLDFEKHSWEDSTVEQVGLFGTTTSKGRKKNVAQVVEFTQDRQEVYEKCERLQEQLKDESKTLRERASISIPFFDWRIVFSEIFEDDNRKGFDIVVGNPPYVEAKKLKYIASTLKNHYSVYTGTADLSIYFAELGVNNLCGNGVLSFITTNKFFNTGYGRKLRELIANNKINKIIDFEQVEVFEDILVSSVIIEIAKNQAISGNQFTYEKFYKLNNEQFIPAFVGKQDSFGVYSQEYIDDKEWSFSDTTGLMLKAKIEQGSQQLEQVEGIQINRGVTTGYNPAFIITDDKKEELIKEDASNRSVIKNMLQGRNIRKWFYNESDENLLFVPWHFPLIEEDITGASDKAEVALKEKYPSLYCWLCTHKEALSERNQEETGIRYEWYALQRCAASYYKEFDSAEKIIWGLTADKWAFTLDKEQHYLPSNAYILTSTVIPIRYILGVLNSKLMHYYFHFIGVMTAGGAYTLKGTTISVLPFKIANNTEQIASIVNRILNAKEIDHNADVTSDESEIDILVYRLYGLTYDEVLVVDPETPITREEYEKE